MGGWVGGWAGMITQNQQILLFPSVFQIYLAQFPSESRFIYCIQTGFPPPPQSLCHICCRGSPPAP